MGPTLYEIQRSVSDIMIRLIDAEERAEGEVTDEVAALEAEWVLVQGERCDKLGAYLAVADQMDAEGARLRERAAFAIIRAKRHEARAEKLRDTVRIDMMNNDEKKLVAGDYAVRVQAGREKVDIGADFIPWAESTGRRELLRVKPPEPDKAAIKAAIKEGQIVTGARLVAGEPTLVIPRAKKNENDNPNKED
jgi:hypothetical protein